jgi:hypothetical protein
MKLTKSARPAKRETLFVSDWLQGYFTVSRRAKFNIPAKLRKPLAQGAG